MEKSNKKSCQCKSKNKSLAILKNKENCFQMSKKLQIN